METTDIASDPSPNRRRDRSYWRTQLNDWKRSGLSKAAYCRRERINITTFYYWCGVFKQRQSSRDRKRSTEGPAVNPSFVPVTLHREPTAVMTVQLADVTLSCHQLIAPEQLGAWLTAIRRSL
jgi:hypothetical protein